LERKTAEILFWTSAVEKRAILQRSQPNKKAVQNVLQRF